MRVRLALASLFLQVLAIIASDAEESEVDLEKICKGFKDTLSEKKINKIRQQLVKSKVLSPDDSHSTSVEDICSNASAKKRFSITLADILRTRILGLLSSRRQSFSREDINAKSTLAKELSGEDAPRFLKALDRRGGAPLRSQVEEHCMKLPRDEVFCEHLPELKDIVDTYSTVRDEPRDGEKWNAYRIHFLALKNNDPEYFARTEPRNNADIPHLVVENLKAFFKYIKSQQIEPLKELISLTPKLSTVVPGCGATTGHPTDERRSVCILFRVVAQIQLFLNSQTTTSNGHVVAMLNTRIDFQEFLKLTEIDRVLEVVQETQNALPSLFQWLNNEISKEVGQRFQDVRAYFQKVESFNRDKARADVDFVNGRLELYQKSAQSLSESVGNKLDDIIKRAIAAIALEIAEDTVQVGFAGAVLMNPLEKLFGGSSAGDFIDRSAKLANSITVAGEMANVKRMFDSLSEKILEISSKFNENAEFLGEVKKIIDGLREGGSASTFEREKQKFIEEYTAYDPKVTRPELTAMSSTWTALIDAACDVIMNTETAVAATVKASVKASGLCVRTKILAEKMIETYAEIYDFQFELIEAMASYMRSAVSIDAAAGISAGYQNLPAQQDTSRNAVNNLKMTGLVSYISYKINIWQVTNAYCDILEYKEGGVRPRLCQGLNTNIASLVSHQVRSCQERVGYRDIPIAPATSSDKAYINMTHLYAGDQVKFKISSSDWLVSNDWIESRDKDSSITVKKFEVFLPTMSTVRRKVETDVKAEGRNQLKPSEGKTYSITPRKNFRFEYFEGGRNEGCRQSTFQNPYDTSKPEICPLSIEEDRCLELLERTPLYPSVYADWKVSVTGYEAETVPQLGSDFKLKAAITLCISSGTSNKKKRKKLGRMKGKKIRESKEEK